MNKLMKKVIISFVLILFLNFTYGQSVCKSKQYSVNEDSLCTFFISSDLEADCSDILVFRTVAFDSIVENSNMAKLRFTTSIDTAKKNARKDVNNNIMFLLIVPKGIPCFSEKRIVFEQAYPVYYYYYHKLKSSDTIPSIEVQGAYNSVILDKLYLKYGEKCIMEVDNDVAGLKEWMISRDFCPPSREGGNSSNTEVFK